MPDKSLDALLADLPDAVVHGDPTRLITNLSQDSRQIRPGGCFVAIPGFSVDGHDYIAAALDNGASMLVVQSDRHAVWDAYQSDRRATIVELSATRSALPALAAAFHDHPSRHLTVIGVTGTDGKSTTCYLIHAMLGAAGHRVGLISGVEFHIGGRWLRNETGETSPEADLVQSLLAQMVAAGDTHVVIEATSHALALNRVDQCNFHTAVFTGLSSDHLDFHQTQEAYLEAKLNLFRALDAHPRSAIPLPTVVVRAEDRYREHVTAVHDQRTVLATATNEDADVSVQPLSRDATGTNLRVCTPSGALSARLPLPGDFNLGNAALAAAAAWAHGARPAALQQALNELRPVPGRMEPINAGQPFSVIVDAAATGPALELALSVVKPHVAGKLILVFGVAGERDPARRTGMGRAAAALADFSLVTSENPRSEDPSTIVRDIADAMRERGAGDRLVEEPDRRQAIEIAFERAQPGDLVLIAGKGAEPTMIYADRTDPWDDREIARELLAAHSR